MSRYKRRTSPKTIERDFPHIIEIAVPLGGLGKQLNAMHDWHHARGIQSRYGRGRREEGRDYIRFCFIDANTADAFVAAFAGRLLISPIPKHDAEAPHVYVANGD